MEANVTEPTVSTPLSEEAKTILPMASTRWLVAAGPITLRATIRLLPAVVAQTQEDAAKKGWRYEQLAGDLVLVRRLLEGDWGEDFLVLRPGEQVTMTYDYAVIDAE